MQPEEGLRTESRPRAVVRWARARWSGRPPNLLLPMVMVVAIVSVIGHSQGVDWGDDFALYMRQAKSLVEGNVHQIVPDNVFSLQNSGWHTFSPNAYPWGWPLLVAPLYLFKNGIDYELVKLLEVVLFCVFLLTFHEVVRRRVGPPAALLLTALFGACPIYTGDTDTVLSDIPYLCFAMLSLWAVDRCRMRGLVTAAGSGQLVALGLLLAFTFNIRREGLALVLGLAALHAVLLARHAGRPPRLGALRDVDWRRVLLPYLAFAGAVVAFQVLLPTALLQRYPSTGLHNLLGHIDYYRNAVAEHVGFKGAGGPLELLGSEHLAKLGVATLAAFAVVGLLARLKHRLEEDIAIAGYLVGLTYFLAVIPIQEPRYVLTLTPFMVYFAYQALPTLARLARVRRRAVLRTAAAVPALAVAGMLWLNVQDLRHRTRYYLDYRPVVVHGPEKPEAQQMFEQVRTLTRGDDVILFFRARAMTFYTDRRAIQGSNLDQLLPRADWYVMERNSTYSQTPLTDQEGAARGLRKTWENSGWVIWRIPPRG